MTFLSAEERALCRAVSGLNYCNPFLPERIELERQALGPAFVERGAVWSLGADPDREHPNIAAIGDRAEALLAQLRERLVRGAVPNKEARLLYEDLVFYVLFHRLRDALYKMVLAGEQGAETPKKVAVYDDFLRGMERFFSAPGVRAAERHDPAHVFACFHQIRRAFHFIHQRIVGRSMPIARLRATVWQSVFTHDMRRYRRVMHRNMGDIATLITGPSGTGKELVARAIGLSRYIPFDAKTRAFAERDFASAFYPLNLSALSPTLIESELFGHRRGAFTGAIEDRAGWLEVCPPLGAVFLDEIGDTAASIQVKLLRVLQTRTFQRIGDTETRPFRGKILAATNRDPAAEMREGRMREDFYYRLCSDVIVTPSLREQLADAPDGLRPLLVFLCRRIVGEEAEAAAEEVGGWIEENLGHGYAWPGNVRELEQCVRNVLIRRAYRPAPGRRGDEAEDLAEAIRAGSLTADALLRRYCALVYRRAGNYAEAARRLQLDRRTVQAKVNPAGAEPSGQSSG